MKVNGRDETARARPEPARGRFQEVMKKSTPEAAKAALRGGQAARTPMAPARGTTGTVATAGLARTPPRGAYASAEHLGQVRQGLNAEAHRLRGVRGDALQTHQEQVRQRVTDLIARELAREPGAGPVAPHPTPASPGPESPSSTPPVEALSAAGGPHAEGPRGAGAVDAPHPEARAQAALELIEKIDLFMKSQRPALALHLGGALNATVEVERTGAREVALRIQGRRGPLPREDLARIRDALAARGLKLSAFLTA